MNAMIFAAGLGSRLRPLTNEKPKALVKIAGTTMLEMTLLKMKKAGIRKVVVNVHHHREQILDFLANFHAPEMEILVSDEKDQLLDTGGGLLKARPIFDDGSAILLYNVDIVTTANLKAFIDFHENSKPLATLMVKKRETSRFLLFNKEMQLAGWRNVKTGEKIISRELPHYKEFGFQGIQIVGPDIFDFIEETGNFSIMKMYLRLSQSHILKGYESKNDVWFDIGTPKKLEETRQQVAQLDTAGRSKLF
jgi:MurNAc alpha-1-phosphate uridylyltransferase